VLGAMQIIGPHAVPHEPWMAEILAGMGDKGIGA
jgi:hypothetical protein